MVPVTSAPDPLPSSWVATPCDVKLPTARVAALGVGAGNRLAAADGRAVGCEPAPLQPVRVTRQAKVAVTMRFILASGRWGSRGLDGVRCDASKRVAPRPPTERLPVRGSSRAAG